MAINVKRFPVSLQNRKNLKGGRKEMITKEKKDFEPAADMVQAAKNVFACMAIIETIRPIVEGYKRKILANMRFRKADKFRDVESIPEIILEPKDAWKMGDKDFKFYLSECNKDRVKAGLHVDDPECCPLLVADNMLCKAKSVLVDTMEPVTKIKSGDIWNPTHAERMVELTLRLLAPFIKEGKQ
ncbi:MAG: hypothetical protein IT212_12860 [Bacteroidia bacterium]|nr:hypothetical protein [Bacteroidia bacterium]